MKSKKKLWFGILCIAALGLIVHVNALTGAGLGEMLLKNFRIVKPKVALLPPDVLIVEEFSKGAGDPIGSVQKTTGDVYVVHSGEKTAYRLKKKLPLFTGDTLVTADHSSINALMNDKSVITLASYAKLTLEKSQYNAKTNTRSSLMNVLFGQVRFLVKRIVGRPNYMVKTRTAVCGVRGTDFAVAVLPAMEEKTSALERAIANLGFVTDAYALVPGVLFTTVVTGPASTVSLFGVVGTASFVGPASVAGVAMGGAATGSAFVGAAAASAALNAVGPGMAILAMPPGFE
ncbi:FecR domain-containing protein [Thermodesulfobacteriota bacterium]